MKNSITKIIYHFFICKFHSIKSHRGGWMLTTLFLKDYKKFHLKDYFKIIKSHTIGWSYDDYLVCGINNKNYKKYLSTKQYCSMHPLNGSYSSYIDDKLILKYILNGTNAGQYMPDYYYQFSEKGNIIPLMDLESRYASIQGYEGLDILLKEKRILAFKLIKSSLGVGFYRVEYKDNNYFMNDEKMDKKTFFHKLSQLKNYIVTEYLIAHPDIAKFSGKSVGCLRYVIGRNYEREIVDIYSFMRFGTNKSKFIENYNSGGVLVIINDGKYEYGNILDFDQNINCKIYNHPDSGIKLEGKIPFWNDIVKAAHQIAETIPQLTYMGIDFCVTNCNKIKIIEINSLTSLDSLQTDKSIFDMDTAGSFFKEKLKQI